MTTKQSIANIKRYLATLAEQVEYIENHDDGDGTMSESLEEVCGLLVDATLTLPKVGA